MTSYQEKDDKGIKQEDIFPGTTPIKPERRQILKPTLIRWVILGVVVVYILLVYFHVPLLTYLGRFLIVQNAPQRSDLIVCLAGDNIERGLATADAYKKGLAPRIFVAREWVPEAYRVLKARGAHYPESRDLLVRMLHGLGVPKDVVMMSDRAVESTYEEAVLVREIVTKRGFRSILIITSPYHSRRAWYTYGKVFKDHPVRILLSPTTYSKFNPEAWWKNRRYLKEVIMEYQKLIYYALRY